MLLRFRLVVQDITGDYSDPKLSKFESILPPCNFANGNLNYCQNEYDEKTPYHSPYEFWQREKICEDCVSTEFCLCGHLLRRRYFLRHVPTGRVLCVGSECIQKINPELASHMLRPQCRNAPTCNQIVFDQRTVFGKESFCSLECFEKKNPNHYAVKKCPHCTAYLYEKKRLDFEYCSYDCKLSDKRNKDELDSQKRILHRLAVEAVQKVEMLKRKAALEKAAEELAREDAIRKQYLKDLHDPEVELLCDCEKYYIPYKYRITVKNPICLVCKNMRDKKPITQSLLNWMRNNGLVHSL